MTDSPQPNLREHILSEVLEVLTDVTASPEQRQIARRTLIEMRSTHCPPVPGREEAR
jgi:hypothetical protein